MYGAVDVCIYMLCKRYVGVGVRVGKRGERDGGGV